MSFNSWSVPRAWRNTDYDPASWRPYANNQGGGAMRGTSALNSKNGWSNWMTDPYFAKNNHVQSQLNVVERNRMHFFNNSQTPYAPNQSLKTPLLKEPITDFAQQKLLKNTHVPGLRTGLQIRDAKQERKRAREGEDPTIIKEISILKVKLNVASEKIELRWEHAELKRLVKYVITYVNSRTRVEKSVERAPTSLFCDLKVEAGEKYQIVLQCFALSDGVLLAKWETEVKAEFSYTELKSLHTKCSSFVMRSHADMMMHEFGVVYRCKPKVYWDEIHHYCNDVMQKYIKDDNGQPGNLINGKINGLFFSARLLPDLTLPQSSPFGNVRMVVNAVNILNPRRHNFYFADFYCNKNIHYVTVVVCNKESETDKYCNEKLIKLNPLNNPFIKIVPTSDPFCPYRYYINYSVWVELYYTEDVELNVGNFSAIIATGAGTSRIGGLPNNKACKACNLYPKIKPGDPEYWNEYGEDMNGMGYDESMISADSTINTILKIDQSADPEVIETLCYLVDVIEDQYLSSTDLITKLDVELVESVKIMNDEIAEASSHPSHDLLDKIAKNLTEFVDDFNKRRDVVAATVQKLKE